MLKKSSYFKSALSAVVLASVMIASGCAKGKIPTGETTRIEVPPFAETEDISASTDTETETDSPVTEAPTTEAPATEAPKSDPPPKVTVTGGVNGPVTDPADIAKKISFLASGDNIIHSAVYEDALKRAGEGTPKYNFAPMYDGIAELVASADISFVNQETVMAGEDYGISGYPNFNSPREAGDTLVDLGYDIVNIANNHMLDKWESGYVSTIEYWKTKPVTLIGGYLSQEDYDEVRIVEHNGVKIALLSYTYGTNGMKLTAGSTRIVPWIKDADIIRQAKIANERADLVFASIHWGTENSFTVSSEQKRVAKLMCENGIDVIIGHHPHVVQGLEWFENSVSGDKTLCIYSLGNMINTMYNSYNMVGGIVTFDIIVSKSGKITVENPIYNPTMCHYSMERDALQLYMLEDYTSELCKAHGSQLHGAFTLDTLKGYVTKNVASDFLPDYLK